ncbi:hypothetical protein PROFUN_15797 [Planoprotostelium fungivorum]|uniref:Uncharacterized protein n=1 Tax=Planoprotostelium fungivorum TaxID=1890364 RepID=A0A2P6MUD0_9EUKA|nr:hypothetical protein PROFUN_15797 [Planoprotostelium fungivorum]
MSLVAKSSLQPHDSMISKLRQNRSTLDRSLSSPPLEAPSTLLSSSENCDGNNRGVSPLILKEEEETMHLIWTLRLTLCIQRDDESVPVFQCKTCHKPIHLQSTTSFIDPIQWEALNRGVSLNLGAKLSISSTLGCPIPATGGVTENSCQEPTKLEVLAAARTDQVELVDLLGWDDTHLSARHRNLTRSRSDRSTWQWADILRAAMAEGSKRIILACLRGAI